MDNCKTCSKREISKQIKAKLQKDQDINHKWSEDGKNPPPNHEVATEEEVAEKTMTGDLYDNQALHRMMQTLVDIYFDA